MDRLLQHWNNQDLSRQIQVDTVYDWAYTNVNYIKDLLHELGLKSIYQLSEADLRAHFAVWLDDNDAEAYEYYATWLEKLRDSEDSYENCD